MNHKIKYQKGFTLIEMVLVIMIMGILMTLAFRGMSGLQQNARNTRRRADLQSIEVYLAMYFARCGHFPNAGARCGDIGGASTGTISWDNVRTHLSLVTDINDIPVDPVPTTPYVYAFGAQGLNYVIGARKEGRPLTNMNVTGTVFGIDCNTFFCLRN